MTPHNKQRLRQKFRALQREQTNTIFQTSIPTILEAVPELVTHAKQNSILGFYWPTAHEIDVRPIVTLLKEHGLQTALPVVTDKKMHFALYDETMPLVKTEFNFLQPASDLPPVIPDIFLVPCVAVDRKGNRLGQGQGHYDRYLAQNDPEQTKTLIAVCYETQISSVDLPNEPHDRKVHFILTDKRIIQI